MSQALSFSLEGEPDGAAIDPVTGVFQWRPTLAQSPSTNRVTVLATDDGSPPLSGTQRLTIVVLHPAVPVLQAPSASGDGFRLTVDGDPGPDYLVESSTNLVDWIRVDTNSSPALPLEWMDPDAAGYPMRFYRFRLSP